MAFAHRLLALTFSVASTAGFAALTACERPPAPAAEPQPAPEPVTAPAAYSVHEWGFIAHHYAAGEDGVRALTFPPPRRGRGGGGTSHIGLGNIGTHGSGGKPILYVHLGEGSSEADFRASLTLREGARFVEHLPPGDLEGTTLSWDVHARRGACSAAARYPSASSADCRGTEDGYCESAELARYETEDSACLTVGGEDWNHLFYRGHVTGALPVRVSLEAGAFSIRNVGTNALPGRLMHIRRNLDAALTRVHVFDAPAPGQTLALPDSAETPAASGRQTLRAELSALGMTQEESDAFMNAWETDLFGAPTLSSGDPVDQPGGPPRELLPKADSLVYFLPAEALDAMVALEFTPAPTSVRRAMLVRIDLGPASAGNGLDLL